MSRPSFFSSFIFAYFFVLKHWSEISWIFNFDFSEQWSPINTEGKKQYDRDFLVQLAKDPLSLRKPANLPSMDIIKERANAGNSRVPMVNASKDWTPGFVKPTPSKTGRDRPAGGPAGGRGGKPAPAVIDLKISDRDITLQVNTKFVSCLFTFSHFFHWLDSCLFMFCLKHFFADYLLFQLFVYFLVSCLFTNFSCLFTILKDFCLHFFFGNFLFTFWKAEADCLLFWIFYVYIFVKCLFTLWMFAPKISFLLISESRKCLETFGS